MRLTALAVISCLVAALFVAPGAVAAEKEKPPPGTFKHPQPPKPSKHGLLSQLPGRFGCIASGNTKGGSCSRARALVGPGPFMGSHAIAISPDGRNVYVAASGSDAIVVFDRDPQSGKLTQPKGKAGCVAAKADHGCGEALGLFGPNSVALSPDGHYLYATAREGASLTSFHRNRKTGALVQLPPSSSGCISGLPIPLCTPGRALSGPDVVAVSPDGHNVYVGSFFGNAVVSFARNPASGALGQLEGTAGCIALETKETTSGCAKGIALGAIEGLAVSPDGTTVYAAAATSNAIAVLGRNTETGALGQASDGSGCISNTAFAGCTTNEERTSGSQLAGANAIATTLKGNGVYATSLLSNSVTSFTETAPAHLAQNPGPAGCLIYLRSAGCAFGRAMVGPEGIALSPDGLNAYVAAFESGAIDVLDRNPKSGGVEQKPHGAGCVAPKPVPGCVVGRALAGVDSVAVSPDGRNVYSTAFESNAVDVFRRIR